MPVMNETDPLLASQIVVRVCLFLVAAIAMAGGALQMYLGQPETAPRLDNVHRFMGGVYFSTGLINLWAAITIREQGFLVYLLALGIFIGGSGRHRVDAPRRLAETCRRLARVSGARASPAGGDRGGSSR
jgi:Domain of unknown function (DUF4345)